MTRSSRELLGVRAFATKVNDCVISRDSNGGVLEGQIHIGRHHWCEMERAVPSRPVSASDRRSRTDDILLGRDSNIAQEQGCHVLWTT